MLALEIFCVRERLICQLSMHQAAEIVQRTIAVGNNRFRLIHQVVHRLQFFLFMGRDLHLFAGDFRGDAGKSRKKQSQISLQFF